MCEHNKKGRIFCVTEDCDHDMAFGCMDCIKKCHKSGLKEALVKEDELLTLIKLYQVPNHIKQQRKGPIYRLYQMLTSCKNEICEQLDRYFGSILNKIKYPFLYHENILDAYRIIRDKNYHKLDHAGLLSFYKTTKRTTSQAFLAKQAEFYQQYVRQTQDSLNDLGSKLAVLQGLLKFKRSKHTQTLHHDVVTEFSGLVKQNSPKQIATLTPRKLSDSEVERYGKLARPTDRLNTSSFMEAFRPKQELFLTPKRTEESLDISMEKASSLVCSEERSTQKIQQNIFNPHKIQRTPSVLKISYESSLLFSAKKASNIQRQDKQAFKQQKSSIIHVKSSCSQLQQYQSNNTSQTDSIFIKISEVSTPPILNMEESINEKMNNLETNSTIHQSIITDKKDPIKAKEENVKKRLAGLIKEKGQKQVDKSSNNKPHEQTRNQSIISRKNSKDDKDFPIASLKSKIQTRQSHFLSVSKRKANLDASFSDSLGKDVYEISRDQRPNIISKSVKKQIPLPASVKTQPTPINSQQSSSEKEIQMAAIFLSGINQPSTQNKIFFLEKYVTKYENNLTAIQYLSFLYLQQGKPKECHSLCSTYLTKFNGLRDEKVLNNLIINNSAALNELGRYSETIKYMEEKLRHCENAQMHKITADAYFNIGVVDKAVYHYERATKLNPQLDEAYYNLAVILYRQESFFNARMNIDKALQLRNNNYYIELRTHIEERIQMNAKQQ